MKFVITFQIADDFVETMSIHSIVCDESEVNAIQQRIFNDFAPFVEVESIVPYIEDNDDDITDGDEDLPF